MNLKIPKILITGNGGLLSPYLIASADLIGHVVTTGRSSGDLKCDLSDVYEVKKLLEELNPDWVVHAAGMTNVDGCENNPVEANKSNHVAAKNIAKCLHGNAKLAYISTDQVYPDNIGLHKEKNTGPINVYGRTKFAGEKAILQHPGALSIRTNLFGPSLTAGKESIDDFVINNLKSKEKITLFTDVYFSPVHMKTLSKMVFDLIEINYKGVINLGSRYGMSKADFGVSIAKHMGVSTELVSFGTSDMLYGRARRTHDLRLDVTLIESMLNCTMPTLQQEIEKI